MKYFSKPRLFIIPALLLIYSCRYDLTNLNLPDWQLDLLGPIARSELKLEDLTQLDGLSFTKSISLQDIGLSPGPAVIPDTHIDSLGPFSLQVFEEFEQIHADSLDLSVTIVNNFPFTINKGMQLVFTNPVSGTTINSITVTRDIMEGESFQATIIVSDVPVESTIAITFRDFSVDAQSVVFESDDQLSITFDLIFLKIGTALMHPNQVFNLNDTTDFDLQGNSVNAEALEGQLNLFVKNPYPLEDEIQVYFLTSSGMIIDSLFNPRGKLLLPPLAGNEVLQPLESKLSITVNEERVNRLKQADLAFISLELKSAQGGQSFKVDNATGIENILVGDLKVNVTN